MRVAAFLLLAPAPAIAAPSALAASGQMLVSLLLVMGLIGGLFVVLKRLQVRGGASGAIRVLAAQSLGTRERAVLVEVAGRQVLIGVAPGRVQTLLVLGDEGQPAPFAAALDDARSAQGGGMKRLMFGLLLLAPLSALAATGLPALTLTQAAGGGQTWSVSLQVLAVMTFLTLLPGVLLAMTSFTRILIVLAILRQALGTGQTPSAQILAGLALLLTLFVMGPVLERINTDALQPYLKEELALPDAAQKAAAPLRQFMLAQTRESDIATFARIAGKDARFESPDAVPFTLLTAAFVTSELKTAFQIGFLLFIPFVVIDLVVASVLMSLGMMMLSPMIISLPFKIMLFVLVDGWSLVLGTLAGSFYR